MESKLQLPQKPNTAVGITSPRQKIKQSHVLPRIPDEGATKSLRSSKENVDGVERLNTTNFDLVPSGVFLVENVQTQRPFKVEQQSVDGDNFSMNSMQTQIMKAIIGGKATPRSPTSPAEPPMPASELQSPGLRPD